MNLFKKTVFGFLFSFLSLGVASAANPDFNRIEVTSNNANTALARAGDTLTFDLHINAAEDSNGGVITFSIGATGGQTAVIPAGGINFTHSGTYVVPAGMNGTVTVDNVTFQNTTLENIVNLPAFPYTPVPTVLVDTTAPAISSTTISTDGNPGFAILGDRVTYTVNFTENVTGTVNSNSSSNNVSTLTQDINVVNGNTDQVRFTPVLGDNGTATPSNIDFTITDSAGNSTLISTLGAITGGPIVVDTQVPILTSVSIASNNADPTYAKTNDTITVTFTASEAVTNISATIAGEAAVITPVVGNTYTASLLTDGNEPEGIIAFALDFDDPAGNTGTTVSATTDASAVDFDMTDPMVLGVTIGSNNINNTTAPTFYAKVGEVVTVTFVTDEPIMTPTNPTIMGRAASITNVSGNIWQMSVTGNGTDPEGVIPFSVDIDDLAGNGLVNIAATTDGSSVIYDRTNPTLPTLVLDLLGDPIIAFKHRSMATFSWSGQDDLDGSGLNPGSGLWEYDVLFTNPINGTNDSATITEPVNQWTPPVPAPSDDPYTFHILVRDNAGNVTVQTPMYTQLYTIGLFGRIVSETGVPIANAVVEVASAYGDTCDAPKQICGDTTDANGNYAVILQRDRDYHVTFTSPISYVEKQDFHLFDTDQEINLTMDSFDSLVEHQNFDDTVLLETEKLFGDPLKNTEIYVTAWSGAITVLSDVPGDRIFISSFSEILRVWSNNPHVVIVDNKDNTFTVSNAGRLLRQYRALNETYSSYDKKDQGVEYIPSNGKASLRRPGDSREDHRQNLDGKPWTYADSLAWAQSRNEGVEGKTLHYVNRNDYAVFRGYRSGIIPLSYYEKRMQNDLKFRGYRHHGLAQTQKINEKPELIKTAPIASINLAEHQKVMKETFQKQYVKKETPKPSMAGMKIVSHKSQAFTALAAKTQRESKINKFERKRLIHPGSIVPSRMTPRDMQYVHILHNGKSVKVSDYLENSRLKE